MTMNRSPIVYFLFFFSGVTALVYEIIWTRMLTLVFGHTVFSVSIVLSAFMAGLGFGCYFFGHAIDRPSLAWGPFPGTEPNTDPAEGEEAPPVSGGGAPRPLLIYGWIEILVFITCSLLSLLFAHFGAVYGWIHTWYPESVPAEGLLKGLLAFILMFIPTTLMGATLPIISKYYVTDNTNLGTQVGLLYGINTLGAAMGCLMTGFVLIGAVGVLPTVLGAACINLFIGVSAIRLYQDAGGAGPGFRFPSFELPDFHWKKEERLWIFLSFVCGFTALAYEVLWTRLLVFSISSTVYSFSMMLAVFLLGIMLGSFLVVPVINRGGDLRKGVAFLQVGVGMYVMFCLFGMDTVLSPPWNSYNLKEPLKAFAQYFRDSAALMLLPTLFLGMSFPLLIRIVAGGHEEVGRATGLIYSSNTLGAILGSLAAGFFLLPGLGTQRSLMLIATINLLAAMLLFRTSEYLTLAVRKGLTAVFAALILYVNMQMPGDLLQRFFMRDSVGPRDVRKLLYFEEGLTTTVAVFEDNYGPLDPTAKRLITNGVSMSASNVIATRYMKLFAHVPILLSNHPDDVLVVCFGTGQTTGAAGVHPRVQRVDSLDLSAGVVRAGTVFRRENHDVLNNPKVNIILQDGRNHLLTTGEKYDVITSEPPPPRTAATVNLYTREYYELAKSRLKPGGIVAQWIPLHSQGEREVDMHFRTFSEVFPHTLAWLSVANEILIIGSNDPFVLDFAKLKERMEEPVVKRLLDDIEIPSPVSFLSNLWFLDDRVRELGRGEPVISDNHPYIEFYLDLGGVIDLSDQEKYVFSRSSFEDIAKAVSNLSYEDRKEFEKHYEAMGLYQRGVMYGNREQLLKAADLVEDDDLFRYHLQAGRGQIGRLQEIASREPRSVEPLFILGQVYYQSGQYENSVAILQQVLEREPDHGSANLYMGYALMELGRREEAKAFLKRAGEKSPSNMRAVVQEIAFIDLLNEYEKNPGDKGLTLSVAQFYNLKKEYDKALEYSLKILERNPLSVPALQSVVFSYRNLGDVKEVLIYGQRFESLDPDEIHLQFVLGEMYAKTLRCEQAIPHLKHVLEKDDTYPNAQALLEKCQKRVGETVASQGTPINSPPRT